MPRPPRENELTVLAYNVWLRPGYFLDGQAARAKLLPRELLRHDVLVLSETFAASSRLLFEALAPHYPYQSGVLGKPRLTDGPMRVGNGGVTILSRWPVVARDERHFHGCLRGPDAYADKGVLYACIRKLGRRYHLFGSHTQAPPESPFRVVYRWVRRDADAIYRDLRLQQFAMIGRFIKQVAPPADEPVVIAGDLNTDMLGAPDEYAQMLELLDAKLPEERWGRPATWEPGENPLCGGRDEWLDYVLWSRSHLQPRAAELEVRAIRSPFHWRRLPGGRRYHDLSDHHAVWARLEYPEANQRSAALTSESREDLDQAATEPSDHSQPAGLRRSA